MNASKYPVGPNWISLRQQHECMEVHKVTGHSLAQGLRPRDGGVLLHVPVSISSWCMLLHIVIVLTEQLMHYKLCILGLGHGLHSPVGNVFLSDVGLCIPMWSWPWQSIHMHSENRVRGRGCFSHVPRLMYTVDWNEDLQEFVFFDFFNFCLHISFQCVVLRENTLTLAKNQNTTHFKTSHKYSGGKLKVFYSYVNL